MAESIFARVSRLLSATVEDTVDRMEQAGSDAVMREAIREADRAIDQVKAELEAAMARRLQAARQQKMLAERADELTAKAKFALNQQRDDLAEAALSRQIDFEAQAKQLDAVQQQARELEQRLEDSLTALQARKRQMEDTLQAFLMSRQEAALGGDGPARPNRAAEKKVDAAEKAFDRAMAGAGGVEFTRTDASTINRVAEIDGMRKSATVAERLAALKAEQAA
ncbi:PspA/IM30 family protein [Bradyrhizobium sp. 147]|uniref:PspA/IM30 family protein n=1 Tax=unclassified Bradyrhizobium TaxID=2631580 RepID=UPI0021125B38|nr:MULTISPECIES: PspA/IM30 family protein [unclassified Bradyrhizobium]MCK1544084.1 PspA/IM30 family protein [Bradyrhizobium sp. 179]MCK1624433.1 PspA/IM30 family protein [Bradyrhizobium sp. 160]MCK1679762.1 PspA/IM30 family protein [Bradyrhizobium sp. 147]